MRAVGRVLVAAVTRVAAVVVGVLTVAAGLLAGAGSAQAALDNQMTLVDGGGRTLTIQQWDTFLDGVFPLDRNRLTREWFHSGKAIYSVVGPGADEFAGSLEMGYQIGFPWSLGVGINFSYTTPNILLDDVSISPLAFNPLGQVITPNLFPGVSIS
ncbi:MAG: porin, partial [Mycobacterium sp.]|nr:porin [Mycobacterium sp.]